MSVATGPDHRRPGRLHSVAAISRTELLRLVRDRTALFFIVVLPVVIIVIIGATIGSAPRNTPVGVLDLDGTASSAQLVDALGVGDVLAVTRYDDLDALRSDIRIQNVVGGVVIPAGYEAAIARGETATVSLEADQARPATSTLGEVVRNAIDDQGEQLAAARFATAEAGGDLPGNRARAAELAARIPVVGVQVSTVGQAALDSTNRYAYTAPSNLVLFVFVNSLTAGAALVESRRLGVTRRMLAAPLSATTIVAGVGLTRLLVALGQSVLILAVGAFAFGVQWGDPWAAAALVLVFSLLATGAGLLVGSIARSAEQAQSIGIPVAIGLAMLGGCMWPLEIVPPAVRTAGHLTPHAWAMDGWIALIFEGAGLGGIARDLLVLAAMAVVLLALAAWRLRRRLGT